MTLTWKSPAQRPTRTAAWMSRNEQGHFFQNSTPPHARLTCLWENKKIFWGWLSLTWSCLKIQEVHIPCFPHPGRNLATFKVQISSWRGSPGSIRTGNVPRYWSRGGLPDTADVRALRHISFIFRNSYLGSRDARADILSNITRNSER